jgi:uncharacterized cupin superfamily protein
MVPEEQLAETEHGRVAQGDGWFVVNARETRWRERQGRGKFCDLEGDADFPQVGINIYVLEPGETMAMYHWEADQEDYLVISGEPLLLVEEQERRLKPWDFVHTPVGAPHVLIGAGDRPSVIVAIGARDHQDGDGWGAYPVSQLASRHGVGVEQETNDADIAYAKFQGSRHARYQDGWLPDA